jgi:hypothetical protein
MNSQTRALSAAHPGYRLADIPRMQLYGYVLRPILDSRLFRPEAQQLSNFFDRVCASKHGVVLAGSCL